MRWTRWQPRCALLLLLLAAAAQASAGASLAQTLHAQLRKTFHDKVYGEIALPEPVYARLLERGFSGPRFVQQAREAVAAATTSVWPSVEVLPRDTQRTMLMPCGQMWDSCAYPAGHPVRSSNHTFVLDRGLCILREASPLVHQLMGFGFRTFALSVNVARPDPEDDTHLHVFSQFDFASLDENETTVDELYPAQQQLAQQFQDQVMRAAGLVLVSHQLRVQPVEIYEMEPGTGFEISANLGGTWVEFASGGLKGLEVLRVAGLVEGQNVYAFGGHVSWGLERVAMVLNGALRIQDVDK
jgi:hypothetical protein